MRTSMVHSVSVVWYASALCSSQNTYLYLLSKDINWQMATKIAPEKLHTYHYFLCKHGQIQILHPS